jgi:poly(3-hydroxybutyrate) depolymerase
VPFGCFANAADYAPSTSKCTTGQLDLTPQAWGDKVRTAYPGYSGPRPRVQLWHGTADTLVPYSRLNEEIEQWTNVFGLSQTPTATDTPQTNWNRRRYADAAGTVQVEAYSIQGAGHSLPMGGMAQVAIQFFGLDRSTPGSPSASSSTPTGPTPTGPSQSTRPRRAPAAWRTRSTPGTPA